MKKLFLPLTLLSSLSFSQVGINTDSPSALLEIKATNQDSDGLLVPSVDNFSIINPDVEQNSMLVYLNNNQENSTQEGFYWWDFENDSWQYIFQSKMLEKNLFKTIIQSNQIKIVNPSTANTNLWFKTNFNQIETPNANFHLTSDGDLYIGKSGLYSILFTGEVDKLEGSTTATQTEVGIFIDQNQTPISISKSPLPSADNGNRSTNHTISELKTFTKGQVIAVKTRFTSSLDTAFRHSSNYSLTISYLE